MSSSRHWKGTLGIIILVGVLILSVLFVQGPFYYQARSYVVMYAYSKYE
jgi:ABC-type transporter Mla subunit MlaD